MSAGSSSGSANTGAMHGAGDTGGAEPLQWDAHNAVLYGGAIAFGLAGLWAVVEVVRNGMMRRRARATSSSLDGSQSYAGTTLRQLIHWLLVLGNVGRGAALVVEVHFDDLVGSHVWWACLAHTLPDLAFISIYCLLILFCAQLYYVAIERSYEFLKYLFFLANVVFYVAYAALGVYAWYAPAYGLFWQGVEYGLGGIYPLGILGVLHYGRRVAQQLSPDDEDVLTANDRDSMALDMDRSERKDTNNQRLIVRRVRVLTALCVLVFAARAALALLTATQVFSNRDGFPTVRGRAGFLKDRQVYDVLVFAVVELLPSLGILWITHRRGASSRRGRRHGGGHGGAGLGRAGGGGLRGVPGEVQPDKSSGLSTSSEGTRSSSRHSFDGAWPRHMQDEYAGATAYPPESPPVFRSYGTGGGGSAGSGLGPVGGYATDGGVPVMMGGPGYQTNSAASALSSSMHSDGAGGGYYSASDARSYPGPVGAGVLGQSPVGPRGMGPGPLGPGSLGGSAMGAGGYRGHVGSLGADGYGTPHR